MEGPNWESWKGARIMEGERPWALLRMVGSPAGAEPGAGQRSRAHLRTATSQDHLPAPFHQRNSISVASSNPLKRKITGYNPNRKQSPDMAVSLLPASETATFTPYVSDPPNPTDSSSVTHTHAHLYVLHLQIISDMEPPRLLCGNTQACSRHCIVLGLPRP